MSFRRLQSSTCRKWLTVAALIPALCIGACDRDKARISKAKGVLLDQMEKVAGACRTWSRIKSEACPDTPRSFALYVETGYLKELPEPPEHGKNPAVAGKDYQYRIQAYKNIGGPTEANDLVLYIGGVRDDICRQINIEKAPDIGDRIWDVDVDGSYPPAKSDFDCFKYGGKNWVERVIELR